MDAQYTNVDMIGSGIFKFVKNMQPCLLVSHLIWRYAYLTDIICLKGCFGTMLWKCFCISNQRSSVRIFIRHGVFVYECSIWLLLRQVHGDVFSQHQVCAVTYLPIFCWYFQMGWYWPAAMTAHFVFGQMMSARVWRSDPVATCGSPSLLWIAAQMSLLWVHNPESSIYWTRTQLLAARRTLRWEYMLTNFEQTYPELLYGANMYLCGVQFCSDDTPNRSS